MALILLPDTTRGLGPIALTSPYPSGMTRPAAGSRAVEVRTDEPKQRREVEADRAADRPTDSVAVPGLSVAPDEGIVVGSADAAEEHAADQVARRVVATLRGRHSTTASSPTGSVDPDGTPPAGRPSAGLAALRRQASAAPSIGRGGGPVSEHLTGRLRRAQRGGEPLAPDVRTAFESAMGADLGSVRLHAGPEAEALSGEVSAQAFTIGRNIFFSAGSPDLATEGGQHLLAHELAHATAPEASAVRRAVVTQLMTEPAADNKLTVTEVRFAGRPENSYTGSMGDHTTAFTVHVKGIRLALEGQPLNVAIAEMQRLATNLLSLPGAGEDYVAGLGARQAKLFRVAQARLLSAGKLLASESADVAALQDYISAYLELREVVPFSTIHTRLLTASGGKGKGEKVEALASRAAGLATPAEDVYDEVVGSFDVAAVALACVETNPGTLARLSPGLPSELPVDKRAALFIEQHILSIESNFPGTLAALAELPAFGAKPDTSTTMDVQPDAPSAQPKVDQPNVDQPKVDQPAVDQPEVERPPKDDAAARKSLTADLQGRVTAQARVLQRRKLNFLLHQLAAVTRRFEEKAVSSDFNDLLAATQIKEEHDALLRQVHPLQDLLGDPKSPECKVPEGGLQRGDRRRPGRAAASAPVQESKESEEPRGRKRRHSSAKKSAEEDAEPIVVSDLAPAPDADLLIDDAVKPEDAAVAEEAEDQGPLTIQLQLAADGTVAGFRAGGRPDSPFSGTMGAHTTAWIVHLDRVRALIRGKTVEQALGLVIDDLSLERAEIARLLGPAFSFDHKDEVEWPEDATMTGPVGSGLDEEDEFDSPRPAVLAVPASLDATPAFGPDMDEEDEFGPEAADHDQDFHAILPYGGWAKSAVEVGMDFDVSEATLPEALVEPVVAAPSEPVAKSIAQTGNALVALQKAIGIHLQNLNNIPGVTLPAARTGGDAEGGPRGVLLEHIGQERFAGRQQSRSAEELAAAIHGLLDISGLVEDDLGDNSLQVEHEAQPQQRLAHLHLAMIERAYGDVLSGDYATAEEYIAALIEVVIERLDGTVQSESEEEADRGSKRRKLLTGKGKKTAKAHDQAKKPGEPDAGPDDDLAHLEDEAASDLLDDLTARWDQAVLDLLAGTGGDSTRSGSQGSPGPSATGLGQRPSGGARAGLGGLAPPNNAAWFDPAGYLLPDRVAELCEAFRDDSGQPGIYLGQTEGQLIALHFGITVDVYKDTPPDGFTQIWNAGDGDCLIHALADIRDALQWESEGADPSQIVEAFSPELPRPRRDETLLEARAKLGSRPIDDLMKSAVVDIVRNQIESRPNPGLGPKLLRLLFMSPLYHAINHQRRRLLAASRSGAASDGTNGSGKRALPPSAPAQPRRQDVFGVHEELPPGAVPQQDAVLQQDDVMAEPAPQQHVPALAPPDQQEVGRGASLPNYALLHRGDHYTALIKTG